MKKREKFIKLSGSLIWAKANGSAFLAFKMGLFSIQVYLLKMGCCSFLEGIKMEAWGKIKYTAYKTMVWNGRTLKSAAISEYNLALKSPHIR